MNRELLPENESTPSGRDAGIKAPQSDIAQNLAESTLSAAPIDSLLSVLKVDPTRQSHLGRLMKASDQIEARTHLLVDELVREIFAYERHEDGSISVRHPENVHIVQVLAVLNEFSTLCGMGPVVSVDRHQLKWWHDAQEDFEARAEPGRVYRFRVSEDSLERSKEEQYRSFGAPAPTAVIAIAECCELILRRAEQSLFPEPPDEDSDLWVRGATPSSSVVSNPDDEEAYVSYHKIPDDSHGEDIAWAVLVTE